MKVPSSDDRGCPASAQLPLGRVHFEVYKDLEPGKSFDGSSWLGRSAAEQEITSARARPATGPSREHEAGATPTHS
ncbi:hypothetical protein [Streptacidiphilus melanogenes]|uniref:hypothetical protein n=1 Tax=Streptacidiphilus melanogenes TaxID=411235 RepID=UPI000A076544|nr:hypothetical protein [Streptacidiphilus melanogenes]